MCDLPLSAALVVCWGTEGRGQRAEGRGPLAERGPMRGWGVRTNQWLGTGPQHHEQHQEQAAAAAAASPIQTAVRIRFLALPGLAAGFAGLGLPSFGSMT